MYYKNNFFKPKYLIFFQDHICYDDERALVPVPRHTHRLHEGGLHRPHRQGPPGSTVYTQIP